MTNKKKIKDLESMLDKLNNIENELNSFKTDAEDIKSSVKDNLNFRDLSKTIEKLNSMSTTTPPVSDLTPDMFGTEPDDDSDEEYDYYISDSLANIWDICESTPNNMELGKKIRELYYNREEATPDTMEETANIIREEESTAVQTELFDSQENPDQLNLFSDTND